MNTCTPETKLYENLTLDQERALYGIQHATVSHCLFSGPADGESALKETHHVQIENCDFHLRYPMWHMNDSSMTGCTLTDTCRAALWYDRNLEITDCTLGGIKAVRECDNTIIRDSRINSQEFGWYCRQLSILGSEMVSEYPFLNSRNMTFDRFNMTGKYSFQYCQDVQIKNSHLKTKDAFWHSKNIRVEDSIIQGEYLGWYSENLHLIRCKIIGTQPLCYCKNLILEDCKMVDADLSFERSEVQATIRGSIISVKNPLPGSCILADEIGEIILEKGFEDCSVSTR